jgi:hypothetical protein
MRSEGNTPKNGEPTFGFAFTTMLQNTGRFLSKHFIAKNNVTTPEHSPYSLDLAADDFYLLSRPKPPLNGLYFCDASGIIKNATEKLKRLS